MKNFTYVLCMLLLFTACKKGEVKPIAMAACVDTLQHDIISVSGPTKTTLEQETIFNVSWKAINGCDQFVRLQQDSVGNMVSIKAFASHDSCSVCTVAGKAPKSTPYMFKAAKAGTYYLKFYKNGTTDSATITDTLLVE